MSPFNVVDPMAIFPGDIVVKRSDALAWLWTTSSETSVNRGDGLEISTKTVYLVVGFEGEDALVVTPKNELGYVRCVALKPVNHR